MAAPIQRGSRRTAKPDLFLSHSGKDDDVASRLATDLNFCGIDVWLDQWELEIGQSLPDEITKAMENSRYIAILITANYNQTVWTKTEYKKAIAREAREHRNVMLPLLVGRAPLPAFLKEKLYVDLRSEYYAGLLRIKGLIHTLDQFRVSRALAENPPHSVNDIWHLLRSIGSEPYIVLGQTDFDEILLHGAKLQPNGRATFYVDEVCASPSLSEHMKELLRQVFSSTAKKERLELKVQQGSREVA